jgi:uncharacterized protein (DUF433 family)
MITELYLVVETEIGPMVANSRTTVYDVMEAYDEGLSLYEICWNYNLTPLQLEPALDYIEAHRERLQVKLKELLIKKAEQERYHRAIQDEIRKKILEQPMSPERQQFQAYLERSRREGAENAEENRAIYEAWLEKNRRRAEERVAERKARANHS